MQKGRPARSALARYGDVTRPTEGCKPLGETGGRDEGRDEIGSVNRLLLGLCLLMAACPSSDPKPHGPASPSRSAPVPPTTPPAARLVLVGHDPLFARGMNAGLAVHQGFAYIGNRTDGSAGHPHPGVLVVDVSDPARPTVAGEIGVPHEGRPGESSRELRIWPEQDLLIVLHMPCGRSTHRCSGTARSSLRFYDVRGAKARTPALVADFGPPFAPHEMFLWVDPDRAGRALLYVSTDTPGAGAVGLGVIDVSDARRGGISLVARWSGNAELGGSLHSTGVSADGTRAYLAHLAGGFAVLDTTEVARALPNPELKLVTPPEAALRWPPGPHSAIEVPGTPLVLTTDEVYGGAAACPWGLVRLIDVADPRRPLLAGELRTSHNRIEACGDAPRSSGYSFSSHNPTVAAGIALVSWHGAGLVAASLSGGRPAVLAGFVPEPIPRVATEDPRLTEGPIKVATWSTPIVADGLIYVVDIRNGLYVLRYEGPGGETLARTRFREGNSNAGG